MNYPGPMETTCPDCAVETAAYPTIQPCPEETLCPSSECPAGEIRCGDGSACKAIQDICDGTDQCPPGDTVDDTILQCIMGNCPAGVTPVCSNDEVPFSIIISTATGLSRSKCRMLCNIYEECNAYGSGISMQRPFS